MAPTPMIRAAGLLTFCGVERIRLEDILVLQLEGSLLSPPKNEDITRRKDLTAHRHRHRNSTARFQLGTAGTENVGDHICSEIVADVPERVDAAHGGGEVSKDVMGKILDLQI